MGVQVSRLRASRLPGYSANSGSRNNPSTARAQSADRRPVVTATTVVRQHGGRSSDTPPSTSSDLSTSSTVDSDVTPVDTPTATTTADNSSTRQTTKGRTSQLRPPKTIVARQRLTHQSNGAVDASSVPTRRGRFREMEKEDHICM